MLDVGSWLARLGLAKYADVFAQNEIDLDALRHLSDDDLKELGLPIGPRRKVLAGLSDGTIDIAVGTHALFQEGVAFRDLGLAVVDEQHRFGVHQRLALGAKGEAVDILVMTATPIPRTLALAGFGDMDISVLTEKPAGRKPIATRLISLDRLDEVVGAIGRAGGGARARSSSANVMVASVCVTARAPAGH